MFACACSCACSCASDADSAGFPELPLPLLPLPEPPTSAPQSVAEMDHAIRGIDIVRRTVMRELVGELVRRIDMASARHVALSLLDALGVDRRPHEDERVDDILMSAFQKAYALRDAGDSDADPSELPGDIPAKEVPELPRDLPAKEVPELPRDPRSIDLPPMKGRRARLAPIG